MIDRHNQLLLDCYLSGQVSVEQWQEHLAQDPGLAEFVAGQYPRPTPEPTYGSRRRRRMDRL
jgi:hypothetical protein